jgi:hypothetical protein
VVSGVHLKVEKHWFLIFSTITVILKFEFLSTDTRRHLAEIHVNPLKSLKSNTNWGGGWGSPLLEIEAADPNSCIVKARHLLQWFGPQRHRAVTYVRRLCALLVNAKLCVRRRVI